MKLKNILIVVKNIEKSRQFYHDLFGIEVLLKREGNVILTEGLVLQDEGVWKSCLNKDVVPESNSCELYFEEGNLDAFMMKLERMYPEIRYVTKDTAEHLSHMNPSVPVLFLSEKEDAVGNFGKGVEKAAELFHNAHMKNVTVQLFDGMRHDIFREKEAGKVCEYLYAWMDERKTTGCRDI